MARQSLACPWTTWNLPPIHLSSCGLPRWGIPVLSRMRRGLFSRKGRSLSFRSSKKLVKLLFPKLFAHVPVEGLVKVYPERGRGRKPLCRRSGEQGGQDRGDPDELEALPRFLSFSPPLGPASGPRQTLVSVCTPVFLSLSLKDLSQP